MQAARRTRLANALNAGPKTGFYWWIPHPGPNGELSWQVKAFYDKIPNEGDYHANYWKYILDELAQIWGVPRSRLKSLRYNYTALPRGRIILQRGKQSNPTYNIFQGEDNPPGTTLSQIRQAFGLTSKAKAIYDEHETVGAADMQSLETALGVDTGVKVPDHDPFDEFMDD
jgi:hypothetical protein